MKEKTKTTIRKIEYHRKESFYLIVRGVEVGIAAGLVAVLYRYLLTLAEDGLYRVLDYVKGNPLRIGLWLVLLCFIGLGVHFLIKWEYLAGGSGIPQLNGEIKGYISAKWWRVLLVKILGGTMSVFSGLSLGREGPSVQLGGMAAKGVARITKADRTTELRMISCGAGAGMSAAFNAPLAGVMFVLEEIHRTFDSSILCMGIVATITADYTSKIFFGQSTTFNYDTANIPLRYYWIVIIIGVLLGVSGVCYNLIMLKAQDLFKKIKKVPQYIKLPMVFVISGVVGLLLPQVLCGGHSMELLLINERPELKTLLLLATAKFFFGTFCFASGAPGGTLYPLCILGAYLGAVFGGASIDMFSLNPDLWQEFVVIGMAGFFSSIVRSPLTGVVLVFELTGNMNNLLALATVSLISYATANLIGVAPFYEALLERILNNTGEDKPVFSKSSEKVLEAFVVPVGSPIAQRAISDVEWGKHCLVVSIERNEASITPKGDTVIKEGDELVILISQRRFSRDYARLEQMIKG